MQLDVVSESACTYSAKKSLTAFSEIKTRGHHITYITWNYLILVVITDQSYLCCGKTLQ